MSQLDAGPIAYEECKVIDPPANASGLKCSGTKCSTICNPGYSTFAKSKKQCRENDNGWKFWNKKLKLVFEN